jgi:hypothetical protein
MPSKLNSVPAGGTRHRTVTEIGLESFPSFPSAYALSLRAEHRSQKFSVQFTERIYAVGCVSRLVINNNILKRLNSRFDCAVGEMN